MKYAFDIVYLIYMLLPPILRKPIITYFIEALCKPVANLNNAFENIRTEYANRLAITGQVIYLEHLLQSEFGTGIYIADGVIDSGTYISRMPYSDMLIAHNNQTSAYISHIYAAYSTDFFVMVPANIYDSLAQSDLNRLAGFIDRYKLIDKYYEIKRI